MTFNGLRRSFSKETGPTPPKWLITGLGNPGLRYTQTRHNIGFRVIDGLSRKHAIPLGSKCHGMVYGTGPIKGIVVILAKPLLYMNNSGLAVKPTAAALGIQSDQLLVIHDDLDLEFGRLKIKEKGGHGGHKGLASIIEELDVNNFVRLRIGIGRSRPNEAVADFVLDAFTDNEKKVLNHILETACKAVETLCVEGTRAAMNVFNRYRSVLSSNFLGGENGKH